MSELVLPEGDLARVREQLERHAWYRRIYDGFRARVETLVEREPAIPLRKGLAFYESCPVDRAELLFDPYAPATHRCPRCGRNWAEDAYHGAWVRQFQGWLAKRLAEAGILYRVEGDERYARCVRRALRHFVRRYRDYPLADNLLGPTRLFQSTYLEAFWLVDMVAAYDLVRASPLFTPADHEDVRTLFVRSSELIRGFDEGISNRQAFNNAGMGAVALLYQDEALLGHVLEGPHGFAFHMRESLLEDGIWYEGETYHFATLDHLLDLAEFARRRGIDLYHGTSGYGSLEAMFLGPLKVMLPDLTFPSRKDSWFGRGIEYHREIYEIGYARYGEPRFGGLLDHAYRNRADRSDLGWRAFVALEPALPQLGVDELRSRTCEAMPGTGTAVLRRDDGATAASLEYGHYGGGHGHPDRLHLNLFAEGVAWLIDPGTGWYNAPELGWYRSTLAHNTMLVDGASQNPSEGSLTAFGSAGDVQVAQARVAGAYPGVVLNRTLVLTGGGLLDRTELHADGPRTFDWVVHSRAEADLPADVATAGAEPLGDRDGYQFLREPRALEPAVLDVAFRSGDATLRVLQQPADELYAATALGIPLREERSFRSFIARRRGRDATFASAFLWDDRAAEASLDAEDERTVLRTGETTRYLHAPAGGGVAVVREEAGALAELAWFGRDGLRHHTIEHGIEVIGDASLPRASLRWEGGALHADLPDRFGMVRLRGAPDAALPPATELCGLPGGASWRREDGDLVLEQARAAEVRVAGGEEGVTFAAGCATSFDLRVATYGGHEATDPVLELPSGWELTALEPAADASGPDRWRVMVAVPTRAARTGAFGVRVGNERTDIPFRVRAPVQASWEIDGGSEGPEVALWLRETRGVRARVRGEVHASWLTPAPTLFALELAPGERRRVSLPLPAAPPPATAGPPEGWFEDAWRLAGRSGNAGRYQLAAYLTLERFVGVSRARFPLHWVLPRGSSTASELTLDRPEQAYWAERPWGGEADASARAALRWDEEGLTLTCRVRDDRHVSDANDEDLYENDSLQVYFDFRAPEQRDSNFAPGVAGYVLAPDAEFRQVTVEAIAGSKELANRSLRAPWFGTEGVAARTEAVDGGYRLEARFPFRSLGVAPVRAGAVIGFDLSLSDNDGTRYRTSQLVWSGARGDRRCYLRWAYHDPRRYGYAILVGE